MPTILTKESLDAFLVRFDGFNDAVLRRVTLKYGDGSSKEVRVILSAQDLEDDEGWSNVEFLIGGVVELRLSEWPHTCMILSMGLVVEWFEDRIYLAFDPYTLEPRGVEHFRKSEFYVAGHSCAWKVHPYDETGI